MIVGITHRKLLHCPTCRREFCWAPAVGLCPHCDLSERAKEGPYSKNSPPCPTDCRDCDPPYGMPAPDRPRPFIIDSSPGQDPR